MTESNPWLPEEFAPGLVSIIIPTFNRDDLLAKTLESVYAQGHRPIEIIVADDGSTDGTLAMLETMTPPNGITLQVSQGQHEGAAAARNRGAQVSQGEFIMFLDSDDLLEPGALTVLVKTIENADIAVGAWRDLRDGERSEPIIREFGDDWFADLLSHNWFATCATLHRRSALCQAESWNPDVPQDDDFHFVAMLGVNGATLASSDQVVALYRKHDGDQLTRRDLVTKSRHTQAILQRVERELDERECWTPGRREALAFRYFKTGRMVWYHTGNADRFEELVNEALRVKPDFKPPRSWYKWIADLAGYKNAERVAAIGRKLFR